MAEEFKWSEDPYIRGQQYQDDMDLAAMIWDYIRTQRSLQSSSRAVRNATNPSATEKGDNNDSL